MGLLPKEKRIKIFKKWIKALRSGKYKQGKSRLHNPKDNSYCCLGVLCQVAKTELDIKVTTVDKTRRYNGDSYDLAPSIVEKMGFDSPNVRMEESIGGQVYYTGVNDSVKGYGFKRIANLIEEQFLNPLLK